MNVSALTFVTTFITTVFDYVCCFYTVITCGSLSVSHTGAGGLTLDLQLSSGILSIGTRAIYSCSNSSYQIIGNAERTCGVNGSWTGVEPRCGCKCRRRHRFYTFIIYHTQFLHVAYFIYSVILWSSSH